MTQNVHNYTELKWNVLLRQYFSFSFIVCFLLGTLLTRLWSETATLFTIFLSIVLNNITLRAIFVSYNIDDSTHAG
jgi:hypothetical protein